MMRSVVLPLGLLLLLPFVAGCSDSTEQGGRGRETAVAQAPAPAAPVAAARNLPRLLETFRVGDGVYVRSLAVDEAAGALWVGTSLGVHEVDLATQALRRTFTRKEGLANEYVFSILVDSQGYKWFGTNGGGLSRFRDGQWRTFFPLHGLADYWVYALAEAPGGDLWIGTWAGANRLEAGTSHFTTFHDELVNEWVYGVAVDERGRVWFGTEGGVSMYDGGQWRSWTHADGLGAPNRRQLPVSSNTGLGTRARHDLSVLSQGKPTYNPNYVFCVLVAADQSIWAGTWGGGVSHFDGERWQNLTHEDGLAGDIVYSIAQDQAGNLWFGTNGGLSRFDGKTWRSYGRGDGLGDDNIYAVAVAPSGDIWVGTRGEVARFGMAAAANKAKQEVSR